MHRPGHETILNQKTKRETAPLASFIFGKPVKRQEGNRKPNKVRSNFMAGRSQTLALLIATALPPFQSGVQF